jgi:hypothetical protein
LKEVVVDWIGELREDLLYGHDDPVFPRSKVTQDETYTFVSNGLERGFWANAEPVRKIFRKALGKRGVVLFQSALFSRHAR